MKAQPELVFLVGFMGAGKTTVGRELARLLNWSSYDLDAIIEAQAGRTIADLFAKEGEAGFRRLERHALRNLLESLEDEPAVIALGGGAFGEESVRQFLRERNASVVHLDVGFEEAFRRCASAPGQRPLLRDRALATFLYEERLPYYRTADLEVRTDGKSAADVAKEIASTLHLTAIEEENE